MLVDDGERRVGKTFFKLFGGCARTLHQASAPTVDDAIQVPWTPLASPHDWHCLSSRPSPAPTPGLFVCYSVLRLVSSRCFVSRWVKPGGVVRSSLDRIFWPTFALHRLLGSRLPSLSLYPRGSLIRLHQGAPRFHDGERSGDTRIRPTSWHFATAAPARKGRSSTVA